MKEFKSIHYGEIAISIFGVGLLVGGILSSFDYRLGEIILSYSIIGFVASFIVTLIGAGIETINN